MVSRILAIRINPLGAASCRVRNILRGLTSDVPRMRFLCRFMFVLTDLFGVFE
jgi:hypothetical protein